MVQVGLDYTVCGESSPTAVECTATFFLVYVMRGITSVPFPVSPDKAARGEGQDDYNGNIVWLTTNLNTLW